MKKLDLWIEDERGNRRRIKEDDIIAAINELIDSFRVLEQQVKELREYNRVRGEK